VKGIKSEGGVVDSSRVTGMALVAVEVLKNGEQGSGMSETTSTEVHTS